VASFASRRPLLSAILSMQKRTSRYADCQRSGADSKGQSFYGCGHRFLLLLTLTSEPWRKIKTMMAKR